MNLPDDVVNIINEYSKPVTRADWRTLHKMTYDMFHIYVLERFHIVLCELALQYYRLGKNIDFQYRIFNSTFLYRLK